MIGVLGGTFAPIHNGHLALARAARDELGLDAVHLIPAAAPPLRAAPAIAAARRLRWVELAVRGEPGLVADDREVRRGGASFTVDTLAALRAGHPRTPLCLLLGADKAPQLPRWRRWRELAGLAHLAVYNRPGAAADLPPDLPWRAAHDAAELARQPAGLCWRGSMPPHEISASAVRARLRRGHSVQGLVPQAVIDDFTAEDMEAFAADEN